MIKLISLIVFIMGLVYSPTISMPTPEGDVHPAVPDNLHEATQSSPRSSILRTSALELTSAPNAEETKLVMIEFDKTKVLWPVQQQLLDQAIKLVPTYQGYVKKNGRFYIFGKPLHKVFDEYDCGVIGSLEEDDLYEFQVLSDDHFFAELLSQLRLYCGDDVNVLYVGCSNRCIYLSPRKFLIGQMEVQECELFKLPYHCLLKAMPPFAQPAILTTLAKNRLSLPDLKLSLSLSYEKRVMTFDGGNLIELSADDVLKDKLMSYMSEWRFVTFNDDYERYKGIMLEGYLSKAQLLEVLEDEHINYIISNRFFLNDDGLLALSINLQRFTEPGIPGKYSLEFTFNGICPKKLDESIGSLKAPVSSRQIFATLISLVLGDI